jgi:hypothetical protein
MVDDLFAPLADDLFAPADLVEQAIAGDEFAFAEVVYQDGWEEFAFGSDSVGSAGEVDLSIDFNRRLSILDTGAQ